MKAARLIYRATVTLITWVAVVAAVAIGGFIWAGFRPEPVLSNSMAPKMPMGSLAVVKAVPAASVAEGDVITFQVPGGHDRVTHRVIAIHQRDGKRVYETKGDNNPVRDPWQLQLPGKVGHRVAVVPHAGYVLNFFARLGLKSTIPFVCFLLLLMALRNIWRPKPAAPAPA